MAMVIELTELPSADPEILRCVQTESGHELHFNGKAVWENIAVAVDRTRAFVASTFAIPEKGLFPLRISMAHYSYGDKCITIEVIFSYPAKFKTATACASIGTGINGQLEYRSGQGPCPRPIDPEIVLNLIQASCLPYCEESLHG